MLQMHLFPAKRHVLAALLSALLLASSAIAEEKKAAEKKPEGADGKHVVAEVNKKKITKDDLETELKRQMRARFQTLKDEQKHAMRKKMLDRLIERELLIQAAVKGGFNPKDDEIAKTVSQIEQNAGGKESLKAFLDANQMSEDQFRKNVGIDLSIKNYLDKAVLEKLNNIPETELKAVFEKSPEKYAKPKEVRARHILFKVGKDEAEDKVAAAKKKAEGILKEAKKEGANFEDLAKKHSEGPTKSKGGDLGYFSQGQMVKPFADAAFSMKAGETSELVRTRFGFHIIKVEDIRGGEKPSFASAKDRIRESLLRTKRQEELMKHLKKLRDDSKVIVYLN